MHHSITRINFQYNPNTIKLKKVITIESFGYNGNYFKNSLNFKKTLSQKIGKQSESN